MVLSILVVDVGYAGVVVRRSKGCIGPGNCSISLAGIGVGLNIARAIGDGQHIGFCDGHSCSGGTAVSIGYNNRVVGGSQTGGFGCALSVIPQISVVGSSVGNGNRSTTSAVSVAVHIYGVGFGNFSRRQGGNRYCNNGCAFIATSVFYGDGNIGFFSDDCAFGKILRNSKVGSIISAIVGDTGAYISGQVWYGECTVAMVNVSHLFGDDVSVESGLCLIFYVISVGPVFVGVVTSRVAVGVNHGAFASDFGGGGF